MKPYVGDQRSIFFLCLTLVDANVNVTVLLFVGCNLDIPSNALALDRTSSRTTPHTSRDTALLEYVVDILELESLGLGEECVDERYPESVEDREDDEDAPVDVGDGGRGHLNYCEDAHPIEERGYGGAACPNPRSRDLRREVRV